MASSYKKAVQQAKEDIALIISQMEKLDAAILDTSKKASSMASSLKNAGFTQMNQAMEKQLQLMKSLSSQTTKQTTLNQKLTTSKQRLAKATQKINYLDELRKANNKAQLNEVRLLAQANAKLVGQYDKLIAKQKIAKKAYMDALASNKATTAQLAKLKKEYQNLSTQISQITDAVSKKNQKTKQTNFLLEVQKANERAVAKELRTRAQAYGSLISPMDKLIARQKLAKNALQNAIATGKATKAQLDVLQSEYDQLTARVQKATNATQKWNATARRGGRSSMSGFIRGIRNLGAAFGYAGAVFLAADLVRKSFNLIKTLQALEFALKTVTKTQEDFGRAQAFVSDISNKFGGNIVAVTERYTKFLAAANQSAVSLEDTERIFGSVTKASGILGLKTDELTGVYLALEQMMSKGKVTTEELRRQLGERLPGAFGIMADALDVSIPLLDEMLKKGEVMSSEALPKFAKELERVYGLDKLKSIETLQAATTRFNNAFIQLVAEFTQGSLSDTMIALFDGMAKGIQFVRKGIAFLAPAFEKLGHTVKFNVERWKDLINAIDPTGELLKKIEGYIDAFIKGPWVLFNQLLETSTNIAVGLQGALRTLVMVINQFDLTSPLQSMKLLSELPLMMAAGWENAKKEYEEYWKKVQEDKIAKEYEDQLNLTATTMVMLSKARQGDLTIEQARQHLQGKSLEGIKWYREELNKQLAIHKKFKEGKGEEMEAVKGSVAWYQKEISKLEERRDKLATTTEKYKEMTVAIEVLKGSLGSLLGEFDNDVGFDPFPLPEIDEEDLMESLNQFNDMLGTMESDDLTIDIMLNAAARETSATLEQIQALWANHWDKSAEGAIEFYKKLKDQQVEYMQTLKNTMKQASEAFGEFYDVDLTKFLFLIDKKDRTGMESLENYAAAGKEIVYGATEFALKQYQVEMQEAIRSRDIILNNELASEEQKELARRKFREEEAQIRNRQAKAERKATLIRIAADTALGIVSALAQIPKFDFGITAGAFAAFIAATGAAQAAIVAAQPLPEFASGHLAGSHEGKALINDANRSDYHEVIKRHGGGVEVYKGRNRVIDMKKGDKVYKSISEFARMNNVSDVVMMNMLSDSKELSFATTGGKMVSEVSMMRKDMKTTWREVERLAKRPVNVNVRAKVELPKTRKYI